MREWRKLHRGIRASDRMRALTFEARWLYILLLSAQDDEGRYPWTPAKISLLISPTTSWNRKTSDGLVESLAQNGLVTLEDNVVNIVGGAEKNGLPVYAKHREPLLYDLSAIRVCDANNTERGGVSPLNAPLDVSPPIPPSSLSPPIIPPSRYSWAEILGEIPTYKATVEQEHRTQERMSKAGFTANEIETAAMALVGSKLRDKYVRHDMALYNWVAVARKRNGPVDPTDVVDWEAEKAKYG